MLVLCEDRGFKFVGFVELNFSEPSPDPSPPLLALGVISSLQSLSSQVPKFLMGHFERIENMPVKKFS